MVLLHIVYVGTHPYWIDLHTVVNNDWLEVTYNILHCIGLHRSYIVYWLAQYAIVMSFYNNNNYTCVKDH